MSQPSPNYIDKITRWAQGGVELSRMNLRPEQRFRALLVMNAYRLMIENPTAQPRTVVKNLAARDYALIVANAEMGIAEDMELMQVLGIRKNEQGVVSARRECEIANDIYCVNQLVGRLNVSQNHLDKLLYQANTRWLSKFGQQTGNVSAIREAQRNLEKMNNDWKEDANPADALKPGVERNITGDISIIKPDRSNYSEQELRDFAKKIGAKFEAVQEFVENEEGYMVPVDSEQDEEEDGGETSERGMETDANATGVVTDGNSLPYEIYGKNALVANRKRRQDPMDMTDAEYDEYVKSRKVQSTEEPDTYDPFAR